MSKRDESLPAVERQAYDAMLGERNRYRDRVEALEAVLVEIAEPVEGSPIGNPWDFYNDVRKLAANAVGIPYAHQDFVLEE